MAMLSLLESTLLHERSLPILQEAFYIVCSEVTLLMQIRKNALNNSRLSPFVTYLIAKNNVVMH